MKLCGRKQDFLCITLEDTLTVDRIYKYKKILETIVLHQEEIVSQSRKLDILERSLPRVGGWIRKTET